MQLADQLAESFLTCKIIREDTPLDEWVLTEFWSLLMGDSEPVFRSALCVAIREGLQLRGPLPRLRMVWDDTRA